MTEAEKAAIRNSTYKGRCLKDMSRMELMKAVYEYGTSLNNVLEQHLKDLETLRQ